MTIAVALPQLWLDDETRDLIKQLEERLRSYQAANEEKAEYYDSELMLESMNIAIPPMLRSMTCCVGWPATCVNVLEERLDLRGWASPGLDFGLDEICLDNNLDVQSGLAHLDALIYGTAFIAVSTGLEGEPDPLITIEPPTTMTAIPSGRTHRVESALSIVADDSPTGGVAPQHATLYLPDETLTLGRSDRYSNWVLEDRDEHFLGRVPVGQLINRPRAGDLDGHSEITTNVRYLTNAAMRTLAAAEVAREFHASPQRYVLGAPEKFFLDETGQPRSAWESYLGRILAIERDENGDIPTVGTFSSSSLGPYLEMIRTLATLLAAESSIPAHYLGFVTDNPTSADAIRQGEARLVKRVERRQATFGMTWTEVATLAVLLRDGAVPPEFFGAVRPEWISAATPTRAADADRIIKLISAGVLQPDSEVVYDELNFTPEQIRALRLENQRQTVTELVGSLGQAAEAARANPAVAALGTPAAPPEGAP